MPTETLAPAVDPQQLLRILKVVRKGDFSARLPLGKPGLAGEVCETLNDIIEQNQALAAELKRISQVVGKEGRLTQRATIGPVTGGWAVCVDSVNSLIGDLVQPTTEVARVIGAVAK